VWAAPALYWLATQVAVVATNSCKTSPSLRPDRFGTWKE
jgi:hypothetical protein